MNSRLEVGYTVEVTPKEGDLFSHSFMGTIVKYEGDQVRVRDQEDNEWQCDVDQIEIIK